MARRALGRPRRHPLTALRGVSAGLSEQDYITRVSLLERVAGNLTPA